jgi:hypothetical protein
MPRIFDNIEASLLPALRDTLAIAERADFCVGYFNLRGWRSVSDGVERWAAGTGHGCRLLIGMHVTPGEELRRLLRAGGEQETLDNQTAIREKRRIAQEFREQLTYGAPTNPDEAALRQLAAQLRAGRLVVKVYLRHLLHAKLYLLYRQDPVNPVIGYLGSSNLTLAGLARQGELNVDVLDSDACAKLAMWFEDRWGDRWCLDISRELADIIDESWASEKPTPPYHIYLKMAYHLAQEARVGLAEFQIPKVFGDTLFDFQIAAVKIAAHHLNKRGGVLIGDVVGLGKSMMATALARIFEDDYHTETLIICPKNLVPMWEDYVHAYQLRARVLSLSAVIGELPEKTRRYRVVLIDESHNLRNKEGKRYRAIRDYIERNDSLCILLSATPYNKTWLDLSAQLGLFLRDDADLGIRPEKYLAALGGEQEFIRCHQCPVRSLAAFEKSPDPDDWRDLMRLYMVRRTRGFIVQNYARTDPELQRQYLQFADGRKSYFPARLPRNVKFAIDDADPADPYGRLYSHQVVNTINALTLPRYGLGNYLAPRPKIPPTPQQAAIISGLSRAGSRLMGFCRTNLFKRLESAGPAFLLSIERHVLRNFVFLHALENGLDLPLGTQGAELLDSRYEDEDAEEALEAEDDDESSVDSLRADLTPLAPLSIHGDGGATVLKTSGPALLGRLPRGLGLEHRVQDRQQFAHAGGQRDLGRFAGCPQSLVERFDHGITPAGGNRGHVQHRPDPGPPAEDHAPSPALAGITVERTDPNQRADLPPVQGPQFGQRGQQGHRSHRADAGDATQQIILLTPDRAGVQPALQVTVERFQTRFEPVNGRLDIRLHSGMGAG